VRVSLDEELRRVAEVAVTYCRDGEELAGIVPAEPGSGGRVYLCAYRDGAETSWLVLDANGKPVDDRALVKDAVSIAALCELAEEADGSGNGETILATPAHLDSLGAAAEDRVAFAEAMKRAAVTVDELVRDVERGYKVPLR
jgi:hypothetical protein